MSENSHALRDIYDERLRQVTAEGWTPEHDDRHNDGSLARAAACYAMAGSIEAGASRSGLLNILWYPEPPTLTSCLQKLWPWDMDWWKPKDPRRDLVRAGALILAEIERLDRAALKASKRP
jgi:hypothetical protein